MPVCKKHLKSVLFASYLELYLLDLMCLLILFRDLEKKTYFGNQKNQLGKISMKKRTKTQKCQKQGNSAALNLTHFSES